MFEQLPNSRPNTPLLDRIDNPEELKKLSQSQLPALAAELRAFLLYSLGQSGGHFGAGLGVVELTIALHYLLSTPEDHLIWDVGHQSYPHKILTGRREQLPSIRQAQGLAPFPSRAESIYDAFGTGHSSTSISAALGMAIADKLNSKSNKTVAVIGDGAMTAGMAFEALNHAAHTQSDLLVILNDNAMSISHNQGGLATYLAKNKTSNSNNQTEIALFEALNFDYTGVINGHDFNSLLPCLKKVLNKSGAQFLHLHTTKGKGFKPAESDPVKYHAINKIAPLNTPQTNQTSYSNIFGNWLCRTAKQDNNLTAITPAMCEGSGLTSFSQQFPNRYFDVAIAEQHALTLAAGMAVGGLKPVVAIYSTFLQRAYDQLIHDIAIQELDVLLAIDRAGLVGEDGATHAGCFDISMLRCLPQALIMTPSSAEELYLSLNTGYQYKGLAAVRYPRSNLHDCIPEQMATLTIGKSQPVIQGKNVAILNFGALLEAGRGVAEKHGYSLIDMRFVKPLDTKIINQLAGEHLLLVTLEDHSRIGGAGSAVNEYIQQSGLNIAILNLGIPDKWITQASRSQQLTACKLDQAGISQAIKQHLQMLAS